MTLLQYFGKSSFHYQAITLKIQKEIKLRNTKNIFMYLFEFLEQLSLYLYLIMETRFSEILP